MQGPFRLFASTVLAALASAGTLGAQTTWYVDASATAPGKGTAERPYASIQYAITQPTTVSGDTVLVAPGEYHDGIHMFALGYKQLTIRSSAGPEHTFLGTNNSLHSSMSNWTPTVLDGFTIRGPFDGIHLRGHVIVRRCVLVASDPSTALSKGIYLDAAYTFRIEHCSIAGYGSAVAATPSANPTVDVVNTLFVDNGYDLGYVGGGQVSVAKASYCAFETPPSPPWTTTFSVVQDDLGVWDPTARNFHLEPLSVCIDAGDPSSPPDPDGSRADIGALPYDPQYAAAPTTYCTGKVHSGGCAPRLDSSGTPSLSGPDDFVLQASLALDGMPGKFLWSLSPQLIPFAGANLCIAPPMVRGPLLFSGGSGTATNCSGTYVWPIDHGYMHANAWSPGLIVYAQSWGRDQASAFPEKCQLSDAIVFQILP